jgi:ribosomal-protein-alanine N-acetyltransferase
MRKDDDVMNAPARMESDRLVLARPDGGDAPAIFSRYASDPDVTRYLGWPRHRSVADAEAFVRFSDAEWARWPAGPYLISSRVDGRLLGSTGLAFETPDRASTGYVLARDAWGVGYATEALGAIAALAPSLGVVRLYALCHPTHRASSHVLEKCGFERDLTWTRATAFPNLDGDPVITAACYARVF